MKKLLLYSLGILTAVILTGGLRAEAASTPQNGWYVENGGKYWYENGIRQGTTGRGKEIYDPESDAWYWLDADQNGKMAADKDVYLVDGDKWVHYDVNGHMVKGSTYYNGAWYRFDEITGAMIKGWYYDTSGGSTNVYYFDPVTGQMVKGETVIDGINYHFDEITGIGLNMRWVEIDGGRYWYEGGRRQGLEGRGKEIYDPESKAWYWLDSNAQGRMAAGKDVYQESNGGKWVRYDKDGRMVKGHNLYEDNWYYFDPVTGAMVKGWFKETLDNGTVNTYYYDTVTGRRVKGLAEIDGVPCAFDDYTGLALDCKWRTIDGANYWYEGGRRQGLEGRGKEIFDPASNAWYWLDAAEGGRMAVNKDVYQVYPNSNDGKWVRYDQYGHMVKGWNEKEGRHYYFDLVTGAMYKGKHTIDDIEYTFNNDTGVLEGSQGNTPLNYVWDPVKYTYRKADGTVDHYVIKSYDDKGRVIIEETQAANQRTTERRAYAYDNNDNLIRETTTEYSGSGYRKTEYNYTLDADGRKVKVEYEDGRDSSKSYYQTLQYDGEGNMVEEITYSIRGVKMSCERCFYNKGNMIQKTLYTYKDGREVPTYFYAYQYDNADRMIEEAYYRYDERDSSKHYLVYRDTFRYDRDGNCTLHQEYNKDNVREKYTEYAYHYYMGNAYERMAMTYKDDSILISGYMSDWDRGRMLSSINYKEYKVEEYHTIYDGSAFPTDRNTKTYTTKDYSYYPNNTIKEIVETEWRLNSYE